jgi:predicted DCC family thiol-disulfide oxidoreductase YuxK
VISVFYDGQCGLCRREIEHYRSVAPEGVFDWIDITKAPEQAAAVGIDYLDGLRALHVLSADGRLLTGVESFLAIWKALPRWRLLAALVALPGVHWAARLLYARFADWRFKRLGYGACEIPGPR